MGSQNYYRALMNQGSGGLNANYLAYKSRVETAGGAILNETNCNTRFQFLDDQSIYGTYQWGIGNYAGNTLDGSSNVEVFFDMSTNDADITQATSSLRPTSAYEFDGSEATGFSNGTSTTISEATWAIQLGTIAVHAGAFELIYADGVSASGTGLRGTLYRWNNNTYVTSMLGTVVFTGVTPASNDKIIVTRDASNVRFYVNGSLISTTSTSGTFTTTNRHGLAALSSSPTQFFNGQIKEAHVWHEDLNAIATDITNNFLI